MNNMSACQGIRFAKIVWGLRDTRAKFVSAVGVDRRLFGRLAMMRFLVEFGIGQSGMYSMVPLYDYENGFLVGFLWSGQKRRSEIEYIVWSVYFAKGKYPVNFAERVLRPWSGPPLTYGGLKPAAPKPQVIEMVRLLGLSRLRLVHDLDGVRHSLSAIGFVLSAEQAFIVLHASPVIGCVNVEGVPRARKRVWLYGEEELLLTDAEMKYYTVRRGGDGIVVRHAKERVNVLLEITEPLLRGRGACGVYLVLTPIGRRIPREAKDILPLVVRGRTAESVEEAAEIMSEYVIPSLLALAADVSAEEAEGCMHVGLKRVCYTRASPIESARKNFAAIYERIRNTLSQHLISVEGKPYRGLEPVKAFDEALSKCKYCLVDRSNDVLVVPTISEALNIEKTGFGDVPIGRMTEKEPLNEYLKAVKSCEVVV